MKRAFSALFGQRAAADEPQGMRDVLQRNGDHGQLLAQYGLGQAGHGIHDATVHGGIGLAGEMDDDVRHERLLIGEV
ncbi:hypothetical protein G6F62_015555 [Rhizopus arrhizus]|nr:hypothetical protein G6F62_015555 [Rhizopus arrhizus]